MAKRKFWVGDQAAIKRTGKVITIDYVRSNWEGRLMYGYKLNPVSYLYEYYYAHELDPVIPGELQILEDPKYKELFE